MIRHRIAAVSLALPLFLSVAATAQELLSGNPRVVLPPLAPEVRQAERDAARAAEQAARRKDEVRTPQIEAGRENPGRGDDVTTGIQQRQHEQGLRR